MNPFNRELLMLCEDKQIVCSEEGYRYSNEAGNLITAQIIQSYGTASNQSDFFGGALQTDNELPSYAINALRDMSDTNLKELAVRILLHLNYVCVEEDFPQHGAYHNLEEWCDDKR